MKNILLGFLIGISFLKLNYAAVSVVFNEKFEECDVDEEKSINEVIACTYNKMGVYYYLDKLNYNLQYNTETKSWDIK